MFFIRTLCLASLSVGSHAWGDAAGEKPFREADEGQIVFVSSSGEFDSDPSLAYDKNERSLTIKRLAAETFWGDSLDFRGREIRNAHIVDASVEGLKHLTVESLAFRSQDSTSSSKHGRGLAVVDADGMVETTQHIRWDAKEQELRVPRLSSFSKAGLEIRSDVDFLSNELKNVNIEAKTTLKELNFEGGHIKNSVLSNVTATDLNLGDVTLDSVSISEFDSSSSVGSLIVVGHNGAIEASPKLKLGANGPLVIGSGVEVDGSLVISGETALDGSLTVSGAVLGSGPYVDISDKRFKKKVETLGPAILGKLRQLDGVSYELDLKPHHRLGNTQTDQGRRQFGFLAQDVEKIFPEVVSTDEDGYKGIQYSRFAPILVEAIKELTDEVRALQQWEKRLEMIEEKLGAGMI